MLKLLVIGIGSGNPDHMTVQAIDALNRSDIVLLPRKGAAKEDLAALRRDICKRFVSSPSTRIVEFDLPKRDSNAPYFASVDAWHAAIAETYRALLAAELEAGGTAAFLVWGDPSLYDSTLRILERLRTTHNLHFDLEVIPGITSVQALAARHAIPLNTVGNTVLFTTGRKLREGVPDDVDTIVVMLDGENSFRTVPPEDFEIYWGAYLGLDQEIAFAGGLADMSEKIVQARAAGREENGWVMDVYILRRRSKRQ
ncbi:MAG: precorrin-6A synthase (deacetylating) [Dongiaceae bacterium]